MSLSQARFRPIFDGNQLARLHQRHTVLSKKEIMKATQKLHEMGQSLWLDNITRGLLTRGTLQWTPTTWDDATEDSFEWQDPTGLR